MEKTLEGYGCGRSSNLSKGLSQGFLGGLTGTLVMDLILMGTLLVLREPATLCFSIVGDTVSHIFALLGIRVAGGIPTGVITHYVVGPLFGILFGAIVMMIPSLRQGSRKKIMIAAFLYVEVLSQPILATTPILLRMETSATLFWFGGSFLMHLILSIVLGLIVGHAILPAPLAAHRRA